MKGEIPNVGAHDLSKKTSALVSEGDGEANEPHDDVDPLLLFQWCEIFARVRHLRRARSTHMQAKCSRKWVLETFWGLLTV